MCSSAQTGGAEAGIIWGPASLQAKEMENQNTKEME